MNRQLLIAALMLCSAVSVKAQTVFSQNFEGPINDIFAQGWVITVVTGTDENFGVFTSNPTMQQIGFSGNAIGATTFEIVNQTPVHVPDTDIIITSPVINLPQSPLTLSYRVGSMAVGPGTSSHYSVYIITQQDMQGVTNAVELAAMLDGKTAEDSATLSGESVVSSFTITEYGGEPAVVAFRLHDSPTNTALLFDDITITQGSLNAGGFTADMFAVYPNPAQNNITINSNNAAVLESVTITDMNGRVVKQQQLTGAAATQVDIAGLNSGMYIATVTSDKGSAVKKIIKQ